MDKAASLKAELEQINVRLHQLTADAAPVRKQLGEIDREAGALRSRLGEITEALARMSREPRISDHAVIRFLERRHGFSFEDVRAELLTDTVRAAIRMGAKSVKAHGGELVIADNTVVTFHVGNKERDARPIRFREVAE